jgi:hypothetical protein
MVSRSLLQLAFVKSANPLALMETGAKALPGMSNKFKTLLGIGAGGAAGLGAGYALNHRKQQGPSFQSMSPDQKLQYAIQRTHPEDLNQLTPLKQRLQSGDIGRMGVQLGSLLHNPGAMAAGGAALGGLGGLMSGHPFGSAIQGAGTGAGFGAGAMGGNYLSDQMGIQNPIGRLAMMLGSGAAGGYLGNKLTGALTPHNRYEED